MKTLDNFYGMTRVEVVPYYVDWILTKSNDNDFWPAINKMIIDKWSNRGLIYIKNEAWKVVEVMGFLNNNGYHILK